MLNKKLILHIVAMTIFLTGCSFKPVTPQKDTSFRATYENINIKDKWWEDFNDPKLNLLVNDALMYNSDLALALNNIEVSRVKLGLEKLEYLPNISYQGSAIRTNNTPGASHSSTRSVYSASALFDYELDLWGKVRNSVGTKKSIFQASVYDYQTAKLSIVSEVVNRYFNLLFLEEQKEILNETLISYKNTLRYRKNQLDAGIISSIVYAQTQSLVANANARLVEVENNIDIANAALAVLTGKSYDEILYKNIDTSEDFSIHIPKVPSSISSDILLRRSDVASSLEQLRASNFLVGVSKAGYFPSISLTGVLGYTSFELDRLFVDNKDSWNIGGSLVGPLFDFGRTKKRVEIANLEQNASFINYDKALKNAFLDVRTALVSRENSIKKQESMKNLENSQKEVYNLANKRYNAGYSDHIELLDAQRSYLDAKLGLAASNLDVANSIVLVYKAFGGGFKVDDNETKNILNSDTTILPSKSTSPFSY
ncbi:multidrug efflux system CmeABC, outer membrane lipoprotein CmeC [Campylobacter blaseri]|uniref:RND transporter n=1 Tax=Campylobacter blaseri TaxID=2042961 RepID=A0A2P8R0X6_9BACT|nr:TolC family protein [Campylobacter blaseri]PSM52139.1 hypothetical protein CQ405_03520 [Campylobacter blaseri]PSM53905.1 hypothetical protein CRN67_03520 [Campylobacter blaseri]QKF85339.1 multidrug efflux system CmeABC, outer membrane lipoprotein CmeC [Campylobacter blaseri]